jgi:rod shape-determining protein MreD
MSPHLLARIRIGLLIFVAILVQTALGSDMRVSQVAPDLMVLLAICAGLEGGTEAGAWVGFWSGLTADMFLSGTPVGLSALTYCLIGAGTGALRAGFLQERRALVPLAAFVGTAASVLLFVTIGDVLGQSQLLAGGRSWLIRVTVIESAWAAVLSIPVSIIYHWAARGSAGVERLGTTRGGVIGERLPAK